MITLINIWFWFSFLYFLIAIFIAFFIPGDIIISKLRLHFSLRVILGTIVGLVLWAWQGYILGYLGLRFLSYAYLFIFFLVWFYTNHFKILKILERKNRFSWPKVDIFLLTILVLGIIIQLIPVVGFGLEYSKGTFLCCGNRGDFLFHYSLGSAITENIPPFEPGMSGVLVKNYHYWYNLVVAEIIRVFYLPQLFTQFQYFNVFLSIFLGLTAIAFSRLQAISSVFTRWLVFFLYFGADAIYLFLLVLGKGWNEFKLVSSLEDGTSFLVNPPRALSIIVALAGLSFFSIWMKQKNRFAGILSILLFASTIGFKVYTAFFFIIGIPFLILYLLFRQRMKDAIIAMLIFPLSAVIYFPTNAQAGGLFWAPFHMVNNFIVQRAFGLERLELARYIFLSHNNHLRVFMHEFMYTIIFTLTLCGTKIVGFFQSPSSLLRLGRELLIMLAVGILGSYFIGSFFLQETGGANTFNFLVSFWIFLSIPAALAFDYWQRKITIKNLRRIIIILIVLLTLPRIVSNTYLNITRVSHMM